MGSSCLEDLDPMLVETKGTRKVLPTKDSWRPFRSPSWPFCGHKHPYSDTLLENSPRDTSYNRANFFPL